MSGPRQISFVTTFSSELTVVGEPKPVNPSTIMAEAFGVAVGVAQLLDCIVRLSKLAMAFKDSQEQVGRYQMVLMSIEKVSVDLSFLLPD